MFEMGIANIGLFELPIELPIVLRIVLPIGLPIEFPVACALCNSLVGFASIRNLMSSFGKVYDPFCTEFS